MSRTGALLLGARFALAAGGWARSRLVLSAAGVALGALLVLVALTVVPTAAVRSARLDARTPTLPASLRLPVLVGVTGLLVPILALVMTATRLGSDERDRRLAAVRLVGATPAEARLMSAAEGGLAAVAGSAAAVLAFAALRPVLSRLVPVEGGVFPADARPPLAGVGLVVVGLPLLATAGSVLAQRQVRTSPLGVVRRAPSRRLAALVPAPGRPRQPRRPAPPGRGAGAGHLRRLRPRPGRPGRPGRGAWCASGRRPPDDPGRL